MNQRAWWIVIVPVVLVAAPVARADEVAAVPDSPAPVYPQVAVLRPPVFPVGMVELGSELAVPTEGGASSLALGLRGGVLRDLEGAVAVAVPFHGDDRGDPGTRVRFSVERVIFDGKRLELTTSVRAEYDFDALTWSDSGVAATAGFQVGGLILRAGGAGLDATLDHDAVELVLPFGLGAQFGTYVYIEASARLATGFDTEVGGYTTVAPRALCAAFSLTRTLDVVVGVGAAAAPVALDQSSDDQLTVFAGAAYRAAI